MVHAREIKNPGRLLPRIGRAAATKIGGPNQKIS
jgi:hypothetical protein